MEEISFDSINELYLRVKPALNSKVKELHIMGKTYIKCEDIFEYLTKNYWVKANRLTLDKVVEDILYTDNNLIDAYVQEKIIRNKINNIHKESDINE